MKLLAEERQTGATSGGTEPTPILLIPNRLPSTGNALFGIASLGCCVVSSDSYVPPIGRKRSDERLLLSPTEGLDTVDEQESTIERGLSESTEVTVQDSHIDNALCNEMERACLVPQDERSAAPNFDLLSKEKKRKKKRPPNEKRKEKTGKAFFAAQKVKKEERAKRENGVESSDASRSAPENPEEHSPEHSSPFWPATSGMHATQVRYPSRTASYPDYKTLSHESIDTSHDHGRTSGVTSDPSITCLGGEILQSPISSVFNIVTTHQESPPDFAGMHNAYEHRQRRKIDSEIAGGLQLLSMPKNTVLTSARGKVDGDDPDRKPLALDPTGWNDFTAAKSTGSVTNTVSETTSVTSHNVREEVVSPQALIRETNDGRRKSSLAELVKASEPDFVPGSGRELYPYHRGKNRTSPDESLGLEDPFPPPRKAPTWHYPLLMDHRSAEEYDVLRSRYRPLR